MRPAVIGLLFATALAPLAASLAGCASPPTDLFTLAAVPGAAAQGGVRSVEIRRIGLAGYLDRPEIVRSNVAYRLNISANDRWGEPLGGMIGRVFTEDLVERVPGTAVFTEAGAISTRPDLVLELDVQRFDADAAGELVLVAQVALRRESGTGLDARARTLRLTRTLASASTPDLVAGMSALLGSLADEVAGMLR